MRSFTTPLKLLIMLILYMCHFESMATQCETVFPTGLQSNASGGQLIVNSNVHVYNVSSPVLPFTNDIVNANNGDSCVSDECSASGSPAGALSLPAFPSFNGGASKNVKNTTLGEAANNTDTFGYLTVDSNGTTDFSDNYNEYFIKGIVINGQGTLNMRPGTYWVEQLTLNSGQAKLNVVGDGTVYLYIKYNININSNSEINGISGNAVLSLNVYSSVHLNSDSTVSGLAYVLGDTYINDGAHYTGAISTKNLTLNSGATVTYQNNLVSDNDFDEICESNAKVHHYDISHPNQALTCSSAGIEIKACENAACTILSSALVVLDFQANNTTYVSNTLSGSTNFTYANTTAETVTLSIANANETPTHALTCNGSSASGACDLTFVDAGFEFFGQNIGDPVPDKPAESNWQDVNLRAVEINTSTGACQAALSGNVDITFGFDCDSPANCLTDFAGVTVTGDPSGEFSTNMTLFFDGSGIASLSSLNYADAGRLTVSAESVANPKILRGTGSIDVYPSYLRLETNTSNLAYTGVADTDNYTAGLEFNYVIGAYGAGNNLLPNYQAENLKLKIVRDYPTSSGTVDGEFRFKPNSTISSATGDPAFATASGVNFSSGEYSYADAYYSETGRITLDVQDTSYLGNQINSQQSLSLGTFVPAYYDVNFETGVELDNTHINISTDNFTYLGQAIPFIKEPTFIIVPKNALNFTTQNYVYADWTYSPDLTDIMNVSKLMFTDTSGYIGTASVAHINPPQITNDLTVFGQKLALNGTQVTYHKVDSDNKMFGPVNPFNGQLNIEFFPSFFTDINGICFKDNYADPSCNGYTYSDISGANIRFGRFKLDSTYGPETESIQVPFKVEYFQDNQWLLNTLDNSTPIEFDESVNQLILSPVGGVDIPNQINNVVSDGLILLGEADKVSDFALSAPNTQDELLIQLNTLSSPNSWNSYLNYDWNGDGVICNQSSCVDTLDDADSDPQATDYPSATVSFGLFRGNDRIIQWREVFN